VPGDREKMFKAFNENGSINNFEGNFRTRSGKELTGLLSAEIMELNGEKCILTAVKDITDLKQMEKEMARLDRLHLVGEMAAGIGHEIRNPMTAVRGFLQLLGAKEECAKFRGHFDLMIDELDRANSIITEFLSLAKNKMLDLQERNLNDIVKSLLPLLTADAIVFDKYLKTELGELPDLLFDEKEIRQLILNLVRNGLEAMAPGQYLTIKTYRDNGSIILAVKDQGRGIAPEIIDKIGTPFFTTKDSGTGLGLATCHSIAARHNATIDIETGSTGTTFFVKFNSIITDI